MADEQYDLKNKALLAILKDTPLSLFTEDGTELAPGWHCDTADFWNAVLGEQEKLDVFDAVLVDEDSEKVEYSQGRLVKCLGTAEQLDKAGLLEDGGMDEALFNEICGTLYENDVIDDKGRVRIEEVVLGGDTSAPETTLWLSIEAEDVSTRLTKAFSIPVQ